MTIIVTCVHVLRRVNLAPEHQHLGRETSVHLPQLDLCSPDGLYQGDELGITSSSLSNGAASLFDDLLAYFDLTLAPLCLDFQVNASVRQ